MAGELLKKKAKVGPTFLGLSLDNMVLLFILGSRLHFNQKKMWMLCGIVIAIFVMCMMCGLMFPRLAKFTSENEAFFQGVVFNVLIYTILIELCPEAFEFKTLTNCDLLDEEEKINNSYKMNAPAKNMMDNWGYVSPVIIFASFFIMKAFS